MRPVRPSFVAALLLATASAANPPTVTVKNGSYYGVYQDTYAQDLFLGMPYAQPPVGDLRFRNPEPLNSTWSDSKNATEYSPECYGYGSDQWVLGQRDLGGLPDDQRRRTSPAFGGDPDKVTIWGESAGGWSVGYQLLAFSGRDDGLFRGAIMQSGAPAHGPSSYTNASEWDVYYNNITSAANCSSAADTLDCLRQVPIDTLSSIFNSSVASSASFSPVIDGDYIQDTGAALLSNNKFVHVPILHGANHDEGSAFGTWGINSTDEYLEYLELLGNTAEEAETLAAVYPDIPEIGIPGTLHGRPPVDSLAGSQFKRVCAYAGDAYMHAPRRYTAETWAANNITSYSYVFNVLVNGLSQYVGATHFQEIAFVFYNLDGNGYENAVSVNPFLNEPETFSQLARVMTRMWTSFIVDQTPNNNGVTALEWPEYTSDDPQNIVFDVNVTDLAYIEPDIYRAEAIAYLHSQYFE
ncbi:hypothetical protein PRIC2_009322 [Phytophthora ramorum]